MVYSLMFWLVFCLQVRAEHYNMGHNHIGSSPGSEYCKMEINNLQSCKIYKPKWFFIIVYLFYI